MRGAILTIAFFLLVGAAILSWPFFGHGGYSTTGTAAAPGQYPIGWDRPEWSTKEKSKSYGPSAGMGSNSVRSSGEEAMVPKIVCAMANTCPM
jgi:hypothetical protein